MDDMVIGADTSTDAAETTAETAARRCLTWGIVLIVAGAVMVYGLPYLMPLMAESAGESAAIGYGAVNVVTSLVSTLLIPMGTTLVGAAIVIRVLDPARERRRA
ncbi:hypothetical protein V6N00_11550 [Tersicoccus sp. MR15.9]|uniref:hypothetical protein n=1 Tax=Tersicoccus mangrovi TaxID=3121635 RepID=UPI002FE59BD7